LLEKAVIESGGRIIGVDSSDQIDPIFVDILEELRSQYAIGYYPSDSRDDGRWHEVRIEMSRPGLQTRSHSGYVDH
jgi:hypothetical protein